MSSFRSYLDDCKSCSKRVTLIRGATIVDTDTGSYVFKKSPRDCLDTYRYLMGRGFDYIPELVYRKDGYDVYRYVSSIDEPNDQKMFDLMYVVSLLHLKTTYYREVDIEDYKKIYEDVNDSIVDIYNYYNGIMDSIETKVYYSPYEHLIARNISMVYKSLDYARKNISYWYDLIKDKSKQRVVTIHNNLDISHYLHSDKSYLISWGKSKIDMPIYDLLKLYHNHYLDFSFNELFLEYEKRYPLLEEERVLLLTLMSIPFKIINREDNYSLCKEVRKVFDYIYITDKLKAEYGVTPSTH